MIAKSLYDDLIMTVEEWRVKDRGRKNNKTVDKLKLTNYKVSKYLAMQSEKGWHVVTMSSKKYSFTRGKPGKFVYTVDTKYLTNQRMKEKGVNKLTDSKDWTGMNNDWQVASLNDAERKKWEFICAVKNEAILYRSQENRIPELLNEKRYEKRFRWKAFLGGDVKYILIGLLIGSVKAIIERFL